MSRRFALASAAAAALVAGLLAPPATSAPAPVTELPRLDCKTRIIDQPGDSSLAAGTPAAERLAVDSGDLTSMFLRVTAEQLQILLKFKDLKSPAEMAETDTAYKYSFTGTIGAKVLEIVVMQKSSKEPWKTAPAASPGLPKATTGTTPADLLPDWTHEFRYAEDMLIFTVPRARLEQNIGDTLDPGDKMTPITFKTLHYLADNQTQLDSLPATPALSFDFGDDSCFGPPPTTLSNLVVPGSVQFSDPVTLKATLNDEAGKPVVGKTVDFTVGDAAPVPATTGADGVATATFPVQLAANDYPVVATFAGDATSGKARIGGGTLKVVAEPTAFGVLAVAKPTTKTRVVTATLLDNDKTPVAGQPVDWFVNGKKFATTTTDAKGKTVFKAAKPTQTVQAKFAGLSGKYVAASSKSVKV